MPALAGCCTPNPENKYAVNLTANDWLVMQKSALAKLSPHAMGRSSKSMVFRIAKSLGLFALARRMTSNGVRILCYHGIWLGDDGYPGDSMFMLQRTFEQRLTTIKRLGFQVVPLEKAILAFEGKTTLPPSSIVITIDDGWYSTYAAMIPALRRNNMPATLYCDTEHLMNGQPIAHMMATHFLKLAAPVVDNEMLDADLKIATDRALPIESRLVAARKVGAHVGLDPQPYLINKVFAYMSAAQLKELAGGGLDIQLHTHRHTLHDHSPTSIQSEISDNRSALLELLEQPAERFTHFCYPSGVTSEAAAKTLNDLGLRSSTTVEQGLAWPDSPRQLLPRILDGENVSPIAFEAELSGFAEILRRPRKVLSWLFARI